MSVTPETHQPAMAPYFAVAAAAFQLYSVAAVFRSALSAKVWPVQAATSRVQQAASSRRVHLVFGRRCWGVRDGPDGERTDLCTGSVHEALRVWVRKLGQRARGRVEVRMASEVERD